MTLQSIMATASSYMADFGYDEESTIVYLYDEYPHETVRNALTKVMNDAQKMMWKHVDDADDLYNAAKKAKDAFSMYLTNESKNVIRLTESELKKVITESVKKIINEIGDSEESRNNIRKAVKDDTTKRIKGLMKGTYKSENYVDKNGKKWVSRKASRNQNILDNLQAKEEKEKCKEKVAENAFRRGRMLLEHEDDYFWEDDTAYIGRTSAYYDYDDDSVYTPDFWTYSTDPNDKDFAGEVYQLNDEGRRELNWWLRCQRFNEYQRSNSFNPNNNSAEEEWEVLVQNYATPVQ